MTNTQTASNLTFKPIKLETVVVLRDGKPVGTIRRYRNFDACQVRVPGILSPASNPGQTTFRYMAQAKAALLKADAGLNHAYPVFTHEHQQRPFRQRGQRHPLAGDS